MPEIKIDYSVKVSGAKGGTHSANPYTFDSIGELLEFTKNALISVSIDALREEQTRGFDKEPVVTVDGKIGGNILNVSPVGKIIFTARQQIKDILAYAFEQIDYRTFAITGRYLRSNVVTLNGVQVANDRSSFFRWLETVALTERDRVRFINAAPYARKLERFSITKQAKGPDRKIRTRLAKRHEKRAKGTRYLVPNGIYALSHRAIDRKYRNNALIKFDLLPGDTLNLHTGAGTQYTTGASKGKPYLYPTILIYATPSGLKGLT